MADEAGASTVTLAAATDTAVLANRKGRRISMSIANVGANDAYVNMSMQEGATASNGVYLAPGAIMTDGYSGNVPPWQGQVRAISTTGSTLAVWERVRL